MEGSEQSGRHVDCDPACPADALEGSGGDEVRTVYHHRYGWHDKHASQIVKPPCNRNRPRGLPLVYSRVSGRMVVPVGGVYRLRNIITGDSYIGSSCNLKHRYQQHCQCLPRGKKTSKKLHDAVVQYGIQNFSFDVLVYISPILPSGHNRPRHLPVLWHFENLWIVRLKPTYNSLNAIMGEDGRIVKALDRAVVSRRAEKVRAWWRKQKGEQEAVNEITLGSFAA